MSTEATVATPARTRVRGSLAAPSGVVVAGGSAGDARPAGAWGDIVWAAVAVTLGLSGLVAIYGDAAPLVSGIAGVAAGALLALLVVRLRLASLWLLVLVPVAYLLVAALVVARGELLWSESGPAETLRGLAATAVTGWREALTTTPPFGDSPWLLALPLFLGLVATAVAGVWAARSHRSWPLAVPVAVLAASILLGLPEPWSVLWQGAVLGVVLLGWAAWRGRGGVAVVDAGARWGRPVGAAVLLVAAAVVGMVVGPALQELSGHERVTLREKVEPPFDPRAYTSPLATLRFWISERDTAELLTVSGALPAKARIRVATMDDYDGLVYGVAGDPSASTSPSGWFRRVGSRIPVETGGEPVTVDVKVGAYSGVWLPDIGSVRAVTFTGPRASVQRTALRYNLATDTAAVPGALVGEGDSYRLEAVVPVEPGADALRSASLTSIDLPEPVGIPETLRTRAAERTAEKGTAYDRLVALQDWLTKEGAYSDGSAQVPPGHSQSRLVSFVKDTDGIIGNAEQYAATFALAARSLGIPARVVVGFRAPATPSGPELVLTGSALTAWVEVPFEGYGWVAFDATPPTTSNKPKPQPVSSAAKVPQVPNPPLTPVVGRQPPPSTPTDPEQLPDDTGLRLPAWLRTVLQWVVTPVLLLLGLAVLVIGAKAQRRRRRMGTGAAHERVAHGFTELVDTADDFGIAVPGGATRREQAAVLEMAGVPAASMLAGRADAAVFAAGEPSEGEVAEYWRLVSESRAGLRRSCGRWRRLRAAIDVSTLVRRKGAR